MQGGSQEEANEYAQETTNNSIVHTTSTFSGPTLMYFPPRRIESTSLVLKCLGYVLLHM